MGSGAAILKPVVKWNAGITGGGLTNCGTMLAHTVSLNFILSVKFLHYRLVLDIWTLCSKELILSKKSSSLCPQLPGGYL